MLNLIKLELKKNKISGTIKDAMITTAITAALMLLCMHIAFFQDGDKGVFNNFNDISKVFIRSVYIIFAGVIISSFVMDEYNNKTINLMFMYPIKRKKIMAAKFIVIVGFIFVAMLASNLFMHGAFYVTNIFTKVTSGSAFSISMNSFIDMVVDAALNSILSLIPVYFAVRKKKRGLVLVTSIILTSVLNSGNEQFRLASIVIVPCILSVVGILIAYLSIRDIEKRDLPN